LAAFSHQTQNIDKTMKRIRIAAVYALSLACLAACQSSMPAVPDSGRTVVGPKGSTNIKKPWNKTTPHEGNAILGPLSNMRR